MQEQQQTQSPTETVHLATAGPIPGISGTHGPGTYLVNWLERTITPVVNAVENAIQHVEEMEHPAAPADAPTLPSSESGDAPTTEGEIPHE